MLIPSAAHFDQVSEPRARLCAASELGTCTLDALLDGMNSCRPQARTFDSARRSTKRLAFPADRCKHKFKLILRRVKFSQSSTNRCGAPVDVQYGAVDI